VARIAARWCGRRPDTYRDILREFAAGASEAGKNPNDMPRMIELGVASTNETEKAIEARKA
jgi:hypothetical protein